MVTADDRIRITSGPRREAALAALDAAIAALGGPLGEDAIEHGWHEALREQVHGDLQRVREELAVDSGSGGLFRDWEGVDELDPDANDELLDTILAVDYFLSDLERAEFGIVESRRFGDELRAPVTSDDRSSGFDEEVRDTLAGVVDVVQGRLTAGEYLTGRDVDAWFGTLESHGVRRRARGEFMQRTGVGATIADGDVDEYPKGHRWERVVLYDRSLLDVVRTDVEGFFDEVPGDAAG